MERMTLWLLIIDHHFGFVYLSSVSVVLRKYLFALSLVEGKLKSSWIF